MKRTLVVLVAPMLGFVLACGGGEAPPVVAPPVPAPAAPTAELASATGSDIVSGPNLRAARTRRAPPTEIADTTIRGRYVMKLKKGGGAKVGADGRLATGNPRLDGALGKAKMRKARPVHRRGARADSGLYAVDGDDEAGFKSLSTDPDVEWIEPVQRYELTGYSDPYYRYQWNMSELSLEAVHARTQGQGVIVAVVDSGVSRGSDSPVNMLPGWDFQDDDADASDSAAATGSPSGSHGTHVAGTIAQASNNGVGVTGIAPMASILPVRVGDYNGITSENIAEGIEWAVDNGANVINISIGGSDSRVVKEACQYAYDHGVVVVAASGNDGYDGRVSYPAAYPTVIAVGAHDAGLKETSYSNNGSQLALLAPGGDSTQDANHDGQPDGILQGTVGASGWGYAMLEGTSMASPHVAGAAALLIASGVKGPDAVRAALLSGSIQSGSFHVLNIVGALDFAATGVTPVASAPPAKGKGPATEAPEGRGGKKGKAATGVGRPTEGVEPSARGKGSGAAKGKGNGRKRPGGE